MKLKTRTPLLALLGVMVTQAPSLGLIAPAGNLLTNPSFESGLTGWSSVSGTAAQAPYGSAGGPLVSVGTYIGGGGSYLQDASGNAVLEQVVPVGPISPGTNVLASGFFGGAGAYRNDARLVVRYLSVSGAEISRNNLDYVTDQDRNLETVLMYREGLFAPPPGTVSIAVRVEFRYQTCCPPNGVADLISLQLVADPITPPPLPMDTELLVNGRFEDGWTAGSPLVLTDAHGWHGVSQCPVVVKPYSDVDPYVPSTSVSCLIGGGTPGGSCNPGGAGNLLSDSGGSAMLRQRLDVRGNTPTFTPPNSVGLQVSAFMGGVTVQLNSARVDVQFLNETFGVLAPAVPVGPVSREERNMETVVLYDEREFAVPPSTAYVDITVSFSYVTCCPADGLIDNVSAMLVTPTPLQRVPLGINLIQNSSFQDGSQGGSPLQLDSAAGWRGESSSTEVIPYGSSALVPDTLFASDRGLGGLLASDLGGDSILVQTFDLSGSQTLVDANRLHIYASCWLGGIGSDLDTAELRVYFVRQGNTQVGGLTTLGPVTAADRNNITTMLNRVSEFPIPATAQRMIVELRFRYYSASNGPNGLADGVSVIAYDTTSAGFAFCPGDGTGVVCPCGNYSAVGASEGCRNSIGLGGKLRATGLASLSTDTLVLRGSQMPNTPALYLQGTIQQNGGAGVVFGDGMRCVGGSIVRLGIHPNISGASQFPASGDQAISIRGAVTAPGLRCYQIWYRNPTNFCTPDPFNLSNGWQVTWTF